VNDAAVLALDQPFVTITGISLTHEIYVYVAPVILDTDGTTELTPLLHADITLVDTISDDGTHSLIAGIYRVQPEPPTFGTLEIGKGATDAEIKAPIDAGADYLICEVSIKFEYVLD